MKDLFDIIDESPFRRWLSRPEKWREIFLEMVIVSGMFWYLFGWDGVWEQLNPIFDALLVNPVVAVQQLFDPASPLRVEIWSLYGMGDHWSAPVIYGLAFIALSNYLEKKGFVGSRNFFLSTSLSLANIGVFELTWNRLYSILQGQWWSFTFAPKQLFNLAFFVSFVFVGVLAVVILWGYGFRPRLDTGALLLILLTLSMWFFWVYYPLPIQRISVQTDWGMWTSSNLFPQTYYVVDVANDGYAAGLPHYVQNDMLHLWNVATKIVTTCTILYLSMVERDD